MGEPEPIVVVIIDDHGLFSRGLELLLSAASEGRIKVAGRTESADEALALVRRNRPQVALVDLAMPPPGGVGAIREIAHHYPAVRILALSGTDDRELALEALAAGAHGFIPKSSDPDVLVPPLLSLGGGLSVLPTSLLESLVALRATRQPAVLARLDDDETALWRLVAQGLESLEIAERTFVSERTAKRMVASLLRKLGVANRVEAALLAGRVGLLDDEPSADGDQP
ncbi:MAG TPA: response regulator transcription factor [Acidimicrobiia bacterium]|nr:response regulator transcription factor [Acidimicrobiia bacterium]